MLNCMRVNRVTSYQGVTGYLLVFEPCIGAVSCVESQWHRQADPAGLLGFGA